MLATAQHPAMLIYLDNDVSQKPLTDREQRLIERYDSRRYKPRTVLSLQRQRGLNENYARELMELHTLGVDNGYSQRDVTELARVLTGWTVGMWTDRRGDPAGYGFVFRSDVHDTDIKRVLGMRIAGRGGVDAGVTIIRKLARHANTADFISLKLCQYLVRDDPSPVLVAKVAKVFRRTRGDLKKVYEAIIFSDDFLYSQNTQAKFKTPFEFVVTALRMTGSRVSSYESLLVQLERMGQPIYGCIDPTGYDDRAERWLDPGVLVTRWDLALQLGHGDVQGVTMPAITDPGSLLRDGIDPQLQKIINWYDDTSDQLGLVLGSPAFQLQ